jgi:transposase
MEKLPDLKQLSNEAKEALIVELWEKIQKLSATLATYEPKPKPERSPKKTSKNSSTPPSKGFKPNIQPSKIEGSQRQKSLGRAGGGRELHPDPDQTIIAQLKNCPQCGEKVTGVAQKLQSV